MTDFEDMTAGNLLFRMLDAEARQRVFALARVERYPKGHLIIRQGAPDRDIFLLRSGRVDVQTVQEGFIVELNTLGPGTIFGEVAGVTRVSRTASVTATEEVVALRFPGEQLVAELRKHPTASKLLDHIVLRRAKDTIEKTFGE